MLRLHGSQQALFREVPGAPDRYAWYASIDQSSVQGTFSSKHLHGKPGCSFSVVYCYSLFYQLYGFFLQPDSVVHGIPLALRGILWHPILKTGNGFAMPGISYRPYPRDWTTADNGGASAKLQGLRRKPKPLARHLEKKTKKPLTYMILPAGCSWYIVPGLTCIQLPCTLIKTNADHSSELLFEKRIRNSLYLAKLSVLLHKAADEVATWGQVSIYGPSMCRASTHQNSQLLNLEKFQDS